MISARFGARIFCHHFPCLPQEQSIAKPVCRFQGEAAPGSAVRDPLPLPTRPRAALPASAWVPQPPGSTSNCLSTVGSAGAGLSSLELLRHLWVQSQLEVR